MANHSPIRLPTNFERLYPGASARATESAMTLVYTSDLMVRRISRLLVPFGLSSSSGLVLSILADSGEPLPPKEIAKRLIVTRPTVTGLIDSLEQREYVRRLPHPSDRRMLLVDITAKGQQVASEFRSIVHRHQRMWFEDLGGKEKDRLIDALHRIQNSLTETDG